MDILTPQDWSFPVPIRYGLERSHEIALICQENDIKAPLLVTDRGSTGLDFISRILDELEAAGLRAGLFADISPNPRDDEVMKGRAVFRDGGHDGVIAIGGGSGMDGGKAISLVANNDHDLWAFEFEQEHPPVIGPDEAFPPLICIPTTAGTGAETESTAMVTDTKQMMKWCVWHAEQKPLAVILDPLLTVGLPRHLTAWTGIDAMVHAIEGYIVDDFHPLCDGAALEALKLITTYLLRACDKPDDLEARGGMLVGSCLGGVAFIKGLGLVHAISHAAGAEFDTHHGLTNAVTLPAVMQFNAPVMADKTPLMARAMGLEDTSADAFNAEINRLLDSLDIPLTLKDLGVTEDRIMPIAEKAIRDSAAGTNPRQATTEEIAAIITTAMNTGRPL